MRLTAWYKMHIMKHKLARWFRKVQGALRLRTLMGGCSSHTLAVPSAYAAAVETEEQLVLTSDLVRVSPEFC